MAAQARDAYRGPGQRPGDSFPVRRPHLLGLPWELMRDGSGPVAMRAGGIYRSLTSGHAARDA